MSNKAISRISVGMNFKFNNEKGPRDAKICQN